MSQGKSALKPKKVKMQTHKEVPIRNVIGILYNFPIVLSPHLSNLSTNINHLYFNLEGFAAEEYCTIILLNIMPSRVRTKVGESSDIFSYYDSFQIILHRITAETASCLSYYLGQSLRLRLPMTIAITNCYYLL